MHTGSHGTQKNQGRQARHCVKNKLASLAMRHGAADNEVDFALVATSRALSCRAINDQDCQRQDWSTPHHLGTSNPVG